MIETIQWTASGVVMIDQTRLPREEVYVTCTDHLQVAQAIRSMVIRGAPAIGVAAAMGIAVGMQRAHPWRSLTKSAKSSAPRAPRRSICFGPSNACGESSTKSRAVALEKSARHLAAEAIQIRLEDIAINQCIGKNGAPLIPDGKTVLTHCNAGALATAGYGTALGVIRAAVDFRQKDRRFRRRDPAVPARRAPYRLGAAARRHPATLITDNMAGHFLHSGRIGCVVVGADRIAANGDVANKIGTYSVAVLAKENNVPFFVAAPISTLDLSLASGDDIPIEQRAAAEVTHVYGIPIAPEGTAVANPAFDVTPNRYVTAIITERGVARAHLIPRHSESW